MTQNIRVLILHDFFSVKGGAEHVALTLLNELKREFNVSLVTGYINYELFPELRNRSDIRTLCLPTHIKGWESLKMIWHFKQHAYFASEYDICIFSGIYSIVASLNATIKSSIYYCHTPPRFVYDLKAYYQNQAKPWQRPALSLLRLVVRYYFERSLKMMDTVLANSMNVRHRLRRYTKVDATVVYPPVDVDHYEWMGMSDYYLSTARLEPYKRVELIVEAFKQMPDKKLVVSSSGQLLPYLKNLAEGHDNIRFTGWISKQHLQELIGNCIATIYIPIDEDFGLSPVESMAAGKPVIGVDEGGVRETVIHDKTGLLVSSPPSIDNLKKAINQLTTQKSMQMKDGSKKKALMFSTDVFMKSISNIILKTQESIPHE